MGRRLPPLVAVLGPLLLCLLVAPRARADIRVAVGGNTLLEGTDKPAGFGPPLGDEWVRGYLVAASPDLEACKAVIIDKDALRPAAAGNATDAAGPAPAPFVLLIRRSPVRAAGATKNHSLSNPAAAAAPAPAPLSAAERDYNDGLKAQPTRVSTKQALRGYDGHGGFYRRQALGSQPAPVAVPVPVEEGEDCSFDQKIRNAQAAGEWGVCARWPQRGAALRALGVDGLADWHRLTHPSIHRGGGRRRLRFG